MYELDVSGLKQNLEAFQGQTLTVGILDRGLMSSKADYRKFKGRGKKRTKVNKQTLPMKNAAQAGSGTGVKGRTVRRKIRRGVAGETDLTMQGLAKILDGKRGLFRRALSFASNKDLEQLVRLFAIEDKTPNKIKMMQAAGRSIVRNSILRKDYGANNINVIKNKRFNRWGVATGELFNNIKAIYRPKKR